MLPHLETFKNRKNMKNLLLFSTILLTSASAFAQLSVKPNGAADSYVYVNDQVLFVTNEINLTRNGTSNNQEASIYLRNNGQLIQAGTTSSNSGSGQLSVQQNTPETNAWSYYYWASPVGYPGTLASPQPPGNPWAGVINLYEPLPSTSITAARQSLTTTGREGTLTPSMTISTRWLYTFKTPGTEREGNYTRINGNTAVPAGYGFTMKGLGPIQTPNQLDQTYEFRGRPNSGTFTIPVKGTIAGEAQMTLAGNPYASALDLNQLFHDTGNEELGAFWYYDEDRTVASHNYSQKPFGYGVYTPGPQDLDGNLTDNIPEGLHTAAPFYFYYAGGGHGGSQGSGVHNNSKRYAPIGQGIMFVGASDGTVQIKNSHRVFVKEVASSGSVFQRPGGDTDLAASENEADATRSATLPTTAIPDNRTPIMRIWSIFDEAVTRDMVIAFYDQATDGYDRGLDGLSAQDLQTDAFFPIGNDNDRKPYVINGIKFELNKQIPIAFKIKNQTKLDIKAVEEIKKPYTQAYIFDRVENTYQQITGGQSASYNLPTGNYNNRFFVVFRNPNIKRDAPQTELDANKIVMERVTFFQNNPQHQLEISNPEGYTLKSASVYDMSGKLVISETNLGDNNTYSFYTGNLSNGVYLVKLMTSDDIAIDYKAIVHN